MAYERSIYSDMYSPNNMFGVGNTTAANDFNTQVAENINYNTLPGANTTFTPQWPMGATKVNRGVQAFNKKYPNPTRAQFVDELQSGNLGGATTGAFSKNVGELFGDTNLDAGFWTTEMGDVNPTFISPKGSFGGNIDINKSQLSKDALKALPKGFWRGDQTKGTIEFDPNNVQVIKASMIPEGFIDKMKSLYSGITNTDAAQTMNTGNKYANLADEAWANKQVIRTPGGEIVVDTQSGEVYPDIASFPRQEQVTEETAPIRTDFGRIDPLTTNQKPGFFEGIGQKLGMTQVSDADRAANEQFMTEQGIGIDNTGRMVGGDFEGMNAPGKSGWGSANFDEMRGHWLDKFGDVEYSDTAHGRAKKAKQDRLKKAEAAYQVKLQQQAAAEKTRQDALRDAGAYSSQVQMDPGGGGDWHQQTAAKEAAGQQVAGPGFGKGAYFYQGGRVGYNKGGRVGILAAF